jgi:hypothetical protein
MTCVCSAKPSSLGVNAPFLKKKTTFLLKLFSHSANTLSQHARDKRLPGLDIARKDVEAGTCTAASNCVKNSFSTWVALAFSIQNVVKYLGGFLKT